MEQEGGAIDSVLTPRINLPECYQNPAGDRLALQKGPVGEMSTEAFPSPDLGVFR